MSKPAMTVSGWMASLKLTFAGLTALLCGVLMTYFGAEASAWWLITPLLVLSVNLLAAICTDRRINRRGGLLVFHVALLAVFLLITFGRLTGYHGRIELAEGQSFTPEEVMPVRAGPWHSPEALSEIRFRQTGFAVTYAPDIVRRKTVTWIQIPGEPGPRSFGDNVPLELAGYELYTTSNKGFSAVLTWTDADGPMRGTINFPSFPLHEWRQERDWSAPNGEHLTLELVGVPAVIPSAPFELSATSAKGLSVAVRSGQHRQVLTPGDVLSVPGGTLRLEVVSLWMGYEIRREPLVGWIFLVATTGIFGLAWHLHARVRRLAIPRPGFRTWIPGGLRGV